ncbi:MAG: hypothetical protein NZ481_09350, partial [Candidatus Kapabacteria bacterium]|nr:hypothetical protein [Candidatus Kapabacteria bacterium]
MPLLHAYANLHSPSNPTLVRLLVATTVQKGRTIWTDRCNPTLVRLSDATTQLRFSSITHYVAIPPWYDYRMRRLCDLEPEYRPMLQSHLGTTIGCDRLARSFVPRSRVAIPPWYDYRMRLFRAIIYTFPVPFQSHLGTTIGCDVVEG